MRTTALAVALGLLAGAALGGSQAQEATDTHLLRQSLQGIEGKEVNAVRVDIPPGWQTPAHTHPGNVFVYVLEGAIEVELEGGPTHTASAGEMIYETPNQPMVGRNMSTTEGARILVFYVGDEGAPLTVKHEQ